MNTTIKGVTLALFLSGCAHYSVKTNIDPKSVNDYFAPASVVVYKTVEDLPKIRRSLAAIEGESCQRELNLPEASDRDARTDARNKASKIESNAIVFTSCVSVELEGCHTAKLCYGQAFLVSDK